MSVEENRNLARSYVQDWNAATGDASKVRSWVDKYIAPDYVHHGLSGDASREQRTQAVLAVLPASPDLTYTLEDVVAEADKVVGRYTVRFTHKGTFLGIPATGKQVTYKGVAIYRIAQGKFAESWDYPDMLGLMTQLGAVPGRPAPK